MNKLAVLALFLFCHISYGASLTPEETVRNTTDEVLKWLGSQREELKADPEYLRILVEELIVPHFDFDIMSRLVLEHHWEQISEPDKACFMKGFRNLLVERYADILLSYNNQSITYEPASPVGEQGYMSIRQTISRDGAKPLPIDYPMRPDEKGWKVVDLVVDGVSLLKSYHNTFNEEINTLGLEEFIRSFPECSPEDDSDLTLFATT